MMNMTTLMSSLDSMQLHNRSKRIIKLFQQFEKELPIEVDKIVKSIVKNPRKALGKAIARAGNQLPNSDTLDFDDYYIRVKRYINKEELNRLVFNCIEEVKKGNKRLFKSLGVDDDMINKAIKLNIFYRPYIGFLFEHLVKKYIESIGEYKVYYDESIDKDYAIDLIVRKYEDDKLIGSIGLQFKSNNFIYLKDKRKYINKNHNAINQRLVEDVYYMFHDNESNITLNLDQMCYMTNFEKLNDITLISDFKDLDKYIKEELERAFEKAKEVKESRPPVVPWYY